MSHEWKWQEEFTERLVAALKAFPDMQREDFRSLFLTRVGEKLELPGPFPAKHSQDPIQALYLIVDECREYKDKAAAVRALSAAMRALKPTAEACAELDECAGLLVWQEDVDAWHDGTGNRAIRGSTGSDIPHVDPLPSGADIPGSGIGSPSSGSQPCEQK
jgi:hypothetical protein